MLKKSFAFLLTFVLLLSAIPAMYASADDNRIIIKDLVISFPVWTGKVYVTFINSRLGDLNSDDKVSAADARLALRLAVKLDSSTRELTVVADVDENGAVNASDARSILRVSAKLQTVFDPVDTNI